MNGASQTSSLPLDAPITASRAEACGKAILVGEHAVVYGTRAVAMPLCNLRMQFSLTPLASNKNAGLWLGGKPISEHLVNALRDAYSLLKIPELHARIEGHSKLPIGAGLGSSAALCVGMIKTLTQAVGKSLPVTALAKLSNELEKHFHGNPSGLDTSVVAFEKVVSFSKQRGSRPLSLSPTGHHWHFALVDSGLRSSTKAMIQVAKPFFRGSEGDRRLGEFERIANETENALQTGDQRGVAGAMNQSNELLRQAGLSNPTLDSMFDILRRIGVNAAKITGSGGGGCIMALMDPLQAVHQLKKMQNAFMPKNVYEVVLPNY